VGQVAAVVEPHGQDGGARLQQGLVDGQVGVGPGVRLHVGVLGPEQRGGPVAGQVLHLVDDLVAAVVALARVALGVLVGQHRARRGQHGRRGEVLRGDQLQRGLLALQLLVDQPGHLGVGGQCGVVGAHGFLRCCGRVRGPGRPVWRSGPRGGPPPRGRRGRPPAASTATAAPPRGCRGRRRWRGCAGGPGWRWSHRARPRPGRRGSCWPPWRCRCPSRRCRRPGPPPRRPRHGPRRPRSRVVHRDVGVVGPEVGHLVPPLRQLGLEDLLEGEPGVIRAEGDAHGGRVYRAARGPRGVSRYDPRPWPSTPAPRSSSAWARSPSTPIPTPTRRSGPSRSS
jgi:hypothetical protein